MKINRMLAAMIPFIFANRGEMPTIAPVFMPNSSRNQSDFANSNGRSKKHKSNKLHVSKNAKLKHKRNAKLNS
jgi:hypothetical protein